MGGRSFLAPESGQQDEPLEEYRLPVPGNRSSYRLRERLTGQPSPGPETGWRTSGRAITTTYGVFRCRAPGVASGAPIRFIASTRGDSAPQYSPDGKRMSLNPPQWSPGHLGK